MNTRIQFDADLIRRYDTTGPRYTSYPTAVSFHEGFTARDLADCARGSNEEVIPKPLSLYVHIPFCDTVCFYCGCNKVVTRDHGRVAPYLDHLQQEARLLRPLFDTDRRVEQLHWGGGTPTFLNEEEIRSLMAFLRGQFNLRDDDEGDYALELDPRKITPDTVALLREVGFNRVSIGVQDFDPAVQEAVNRIQPEAQTRAIYEAARRQGFRSINFDLIYGLPRQTPASFAATVDKVLALRPDRVAVFNYAHLPHMFKPQRRIDEAELPSPAQKLEILQDTIERLTAGGYVYIGMDHFALPDDSLAVAQREGSLYRNFQGFSPHAECDLVAMGISAISRVGDCYAQNVRTLDEYYARLDAGQLPVARGIRLTADDIIRRDVINEIICHGRLDIAPLEKRYGLDFAEYFATEWQALAPMEQDGLLERSEAGLVVTPVGRLLVRNIAMVFDRYLDRHQAGQRFSRVI